MDSFELRRRTGGFFEGTEPVYLTRAPGRLDVMGGVADYSGSVVLEATLAEATVCAFQWRADTRLRLWSDGIEREGFEPRVELDVAELAVDRALPVALATRPIRQHLAVDPRRRWVAYVAGCFSVLAAAGVAPVWTRGANLYLHSNLPLGAGVASSASVEVATMRAIEVAAGLRLDGLRLARLCQQVENHIAGAPCGIMDQVTCALGEAGKLLALRCQPHDILGWVEVPEPCRLYGIHSGVKHTIGGARYGRARCAAFMGLAILTVERPETVLDGHLCNLTPRLFRRSCYELLPGRMTGREFLAHYGRAADSVTQVEPETTYSIRGAVEHAVYENDRVLRFIDALSAAREDTSSGALVEAGKLMYASHWSYGSRIGLGAPETDLIVRLARERGPAAGICGAKITGGGSGGTVALLAAADAEEAVRGVAAEYEAQTGNRSYVFTGTSPGAFAGGWERFVL